MKQVQWFPGHMFKSLREIKENLKLMDVVFIILDARLPKSSMNPEILKLIKDKPTLLLMNKMDLADHKNLSVWINYYQKLGFKSLLIDAQSGKNVNKIYQSAKELLAKRFNRQEKKGLIDQTIRAIIIGIPNVGKSTLINKISKKKVTDVANKPGVTKSLKWIKLADNFQLLDTPGVLWPKFDDEITGLNLAVTGAIKDDTLPLERVAYYAVEYLKNNYLDKLNEKYQIDATNLEPYQIIDQIGRLRNALTKGNEVNHMRVYQMILADIRNNNLGGLSFDKPKSV